VASRTQFSWHYWLSQASSDVGGQPWSGFDGFNVRIWQCAPKARHSTKRLHAAAAARADIERMSCELATIGIRLNERCWPMPKLDGAEKHPIHNLTQRPTQKNNRSKETGTVLMVVTSTNDHSIRLNGCDRKICHHSCHSLHKMGWLGYVEGKIAL
jgi:hypothetical protein